MQGEADLIEVEASSSDVSAMASSSNTSSVMEKSESKNSPNSRQESRWYHRFLVRIRRRQQQEVRECYTYLLYKYFKYIIIAPGRHKTIQGGTTNCSLIIGVVEKHKMLD